MCVLGETTVYLTLTIRLLFSKKTLTLREDSCTPTEYCTDSAVYSIMLGYVRLRMTMTFKKIIHSELRNNFKQINNKNSSNF